jgi:hypothetical protein
VRVPAVTLLGHTHSHPPHTHTHAHTHNHSYIRIDTHYARYTHAYADTRRTLTMAARAVMPRYLRLALEEVRKRAMLLAAAAINAGFG